MTQKEFEERTGLKVSADYFANVEKVYMAAGDMDKDLFCKEWMKCRSSQLVAELYRETERLKELLKERNAELEAAERKEEKTRYSFADFLLEQAERDCSKYALYNEAVELVGHAHIIRRKMELDLTLWDDDKSYILENLD
ncbi:MAG: hypothetical protein IJV28_07580 [Paludibacteraceae bacterium]|nr:hypothetical protein [Paludibacteraceae bacterium]